MVAYTKLFSIYQILIVPHAQRAIVLRAHLACSALPNIATRRWRNAIDLHARLLQDGFKAFCQTNEALAARGTCGSPDPERLVNEVHSAHLLHCLLLEGFWLLNG